MTHEEGAVNILLVNVLPTASHSGGAGQLWSFCSLYVGDLTNVECAH
jgi:hypothetical protein